MISKDTLPDFFLGSSDSDIFLIPRACWIKKKKKAVFSDYDGMWITIDSPLIGQSYNLGSNDIRDLILFPHFAETSLFPIKKWPFYVYVYRIINDNILKNNKSIENEDVEMIAWGELYQTIKESSN